MKPLKRASVGLLAALIAVGPGGTLRAANVADNANLLMEPEQPWPVAPDFTFAVGPSSIHSLRDYRGERIVLLVLYSLPGSRPRIADPALGSDALELEDVEAIFAPTDRLGPGPRLLLPVVA